MSKVRADRLSNREGTGAPQLQYGAEIPVGAAVTGSGNIDITGSIYSAGISTFNAVNVVGVVTALGFVGDLTGTATTATTATTAGTATTATVSQGLTGTPSIVVGLTTVGTALSLTGYYVENITAMAALDVDCSTANYFTKTINGNSIFTFSNPPSGGAYSFTLELTHTSGTVTWPTEVKWPADTPPTLTTGKTHLFIFVTDDGGSRWRGSSLVDYTN